MENIIFVIMFAIFSFGENLHNQEQNSEIKTKMSSEDLPIEFGSPGADLPPGCRRKPGGSGQTGCEISCINGFSAACSGVNATGMWSCGWTNVDGSHGSAYGGGTSPCDW